MACSDDDGDGDCPAGQLQCACDDQGRCAGGLECVNGACVEPQAVCGNDAIEPDEACDDGAANSDEWSAGGHCNASCSGTAPYCGDETTDEPDESCDDGAANSDEWSAGGHCNASCSGTAPYCGDETTDEPDEACDDGAANSDEWSASAHCNASCSGTAPYCGDETTDAPDESCDDGAANSDEWSAAAHCNASCSGTAPYCGDETTDAPDEACDDGAANSDEWSAGGHCNASCSGTAPYCGDETTDAPDEACDDGAANSDEWSAAGHCNASCSGTAPYCGDSVVDTPFEFCDDGVLNGTGGDNCNADCSFKPIDCLSCHDTAQDDGDGAPSGGRRAVALEFPSGSLHAHMAGTEPADADCLVCHLASGTHGNGLIELIDADDGSVYAFEYPADLSSEPDVSDFCASCHDADGATRLGAPLDPFGSGNPAQNTLDRFAGTLAWREWYGDLCFGGEGTTRHVNSHHDISDADQAASGAKLECLNCHSAHASADTQPVADPFDPTRAWSGTPNDFCLTCHSGTTEPASLVLPPGVVAPEVWVDATGAPCDVSGACTTESYLVPAQRVLGSCDYQAGPWWTSFLWSRSPHGADSKRGWPGYSGAPSAELPCAACHDPHGSWSPTNPAGNPYAIRDYVDGSSYVDDGVRFGAAWTGPPWNVMGVAREVIVTVTPGASPPPLGTDPAVVDWGGSTGLCSACHSTWLNAYSWHSFCDGCQNCHNHGSDFGAVDWGPAPDDSTRCSLCGNGAVDGVEECDDGNLLDGDGCSNECTVE